MIILGIILLILGLLLSVPVLWVIGLVLVAVGGMTSVVKETWWRGAYFAAPLETAVLAGKPWLPPEVAKRIRFS